MTDEDVALVLASWEPYREQIESTLERYDEDTSWRAFRNAAFEWLCDVPCPYCNRVQEENKSKVTTMRLSDHKRNVFSQFGEDGILEKLFEGTRDGFCVEFGASNGLYMSNTANLIRHHGWRGVLIEGAPHKFRAIGNNYPSAKYAVRALNHVVGLEGEYTLDRILAREAPETPKEFELLSIDIDGCDYHVWEGIKDYRPKVVVVEFNPTIPAEVEFVQPRDLTLFQGSSLLSLTKLAASKGYALVACTDTNAIFAQLNFGFADVGTIEELWTDRRYVTYVFSLYDGTVKLAGSKQLPWHGVSFDEEKVQVLTPEQRKFSGAL